MLVKHYLTVLNVLQKHLWLVNQMDQFEWMYGRRGPGWKVRLNWPSNLLYFNVNTRFTAALLTAKQQTCTVKIRCVTFTSCLWCNGVILNPEYYCDRTSHCLQEEVTTTVVLFYCCEVLLLCPSHRNWSWTEVQTFVLVSFALVESGNKDGTNKLFWHFFMFLFALWGKKTLPHVLHVHWE